MLEELRSLNAARTGHARARTVKVARCSRDELLDFKLLGGLEPGAGLFVSKVERHSNAHKAGLKRGDQVRILDPPMAWCV